MAATSNMTSSTPKTVNCRLDSGFTTFLLGGKGVEHGGVRRFPLDFCLGRGFGKGRTSLGGTLVGVLYEDDGDWLRAELFTCKDRYTTSCML